MKIHSPALFLLLGMLFWGSTQAQQTAASLGIKKETETNPNVLINRLEQPMHDTDRISLMLRICHVYWLKRSVNPQRLDSCIYWAEIAGNLSNKINYTEGSNEAAFMKVAAWIKKKDMKSAEEVVRPTWGELRVQLLLSMAEHYVYDFTAASPEYSKALPLILEAKATAEKTGSARWWKECPVVLGKYYFKQGNPTAGKNAFMEATRKHHEAKDYATEGWSWWQMAQYMPETDSTFQYVRYAFSQAVQCYAKTNDRKSFAYSLRDLAQINITYNYYDSSEKQYQLVIETLESIGEKITPTTYIQMGGLYRCMGQYDKALAYAFKALDHPDADAPKKILAHGELAAIYGRLEDFPNCIKHYQLAVTYLTPQQKSLRLHYAKFIAFAMKSGGDPAGALKYLSAAVKENPPKTFTDKQQLASTFGAIYEELKQYDNAEQQYLEMLKLHPAVNEEHETLLGGFNKTTTSAIFFTLGRFYVARGRYKEGDVYLKKALESPHTLDAALRKAMLYVKFKSDSAQGRYITAINNLNEHVKMNDSINSVQRNKQITELNIKYESEQRKKDIKLLESKETLHRAELQKATIIRNIIISGAIGLLLLALLAYIAYRSKKKSNTLLYIQQQEIDHQNQALQGLLAQKEQLLTDKEWLLKEVHHRVKNNLQIVMSLLSTQSRYLKSEDAVEAILESRNRIKSISLIHQKLYTGNNLSTIRLPEYVNDLLDNLTLAFDTRAQQIQFVQQVDEISVDTEQAVPLGLILNEAVTNAIKHAFSSQEGMVSVSLLQKETTIELSISDNGKGLPNNFNINTTHSQGMVMIQGLTRQLKGIFQISSSKGTHILITFPLLNSFES